MDQNSSQILSQLQAQQATNKGAGDYLNEANAKLGVSGAQDTVKGLRTSIDNTTKLLEKVAPSVMGRTQNSLVTNAQATKQISNEQAPISKNLTELGSQYTEAGQNLSNLRSQAAQEAQLGYQSQQDKNSYLQNLYNTMYTKEQNAAEAARQVAADAEAKRQNDAKLAEEQRQFNVSQDNKTPKVNYNTTTSASGGLNFFADGQPVTAAQYIEGKGGNMVDLRNILAKSKDPTDAKIVKAIDSGMSQSELIKKYPYVFRTS